MYMSIPFTPLSANAPETTSSTLLIFIFIHSDIYIFDNIAYIVSAKLEWDKEEIVRQQRDIEEKSWKRTDRVSSNNIHHNPLKTRFQTKRQGEGRRGTVRGVWLAYRKPYPRT
eukprot:g50914.t1